MDFTIREYTTLIRKELLNLYNSVGWTNYTNNPQMLEKAYKNSLKVLGAYVGEKLVGIIRVVGDGHSVIYIQDILILSEYQHAGIGTALMKEVLEQYKDVYQKVLLTDNIEKNVQFYKSMGFDMDTDMNCRAFLKMY